MHDPPAYVWAIIIAASMCGQRARMAWSWACSSAWRWSGRVSSQRVIWRVFGIAGAGPGAASACRNGRYSRDVKGGGRSVCIGQCLSAWPAGGTVLKTSLSNDDEKELQEALHGSQAAAQ